MGSSDHPTPTTEVLSRRRRWAAITVLAVGLIGASALVAVPAIAEGGESGPAEKLLVCESGVVDHGDGIQTSSASVERVAADAPVPDGCRTK
jgi:hypothetical protein